MGMTDKHKKKTDLRWIDLTLGMRVQVWNELRAKKVKGSEARKMRRAIKALNVDEDLLDELNELQLLERASNRVDLAKGEESVKADLKEHRAVKAKRQEFEDAVIRLPVSMESLEVYAKHIAGDDELTGAQIDELGEFFDEIENAQKGDVEGPNASYLYEDGIVPPPPAKTDGESAPARSKPSKGAPVS